MMYENYYWGMNTIWWIVWFVMIFWIFAVPYDIPGQRRPRDTPLDILKQRYAMGQLTTEEYKDRKKLLEEELAEQRRSFGTQKLH